MKTPFVALVVVALCAAAPVSAGKGPKPVLQATPSPVGFGTRPVGSFTLKDATVKNAGASAVNLLVTIDSMPDDFSFGLLPDPRARRSSPR